MRSIIVGCKQTLLWFQMGPLSHLEMDLLSLGGLVWVGDGEVDLLSHSLLCRPLGEGGLDSLGGLLDAGGFETGPWGPERPRTLQDEGEVGEADLLEVLVTAEGSSSGSECFFNDDLLWVWFGV